MAYITSISITDEAVRKYLESRDDRSAFIVQLVRDFMENNKPNAAGELEALVEINEFGYMDEYRMYEKMAQETGFHLTARDWLMCRTDGTLRQLAQRMKARPK